MVKVTIEQAHMDLRCSWGVYCAWHAVHIILRASQSSAMSAAGVRRGNIRLVAVRNRAEARSLLEVHTGAGPGSGTRRPRGFIEGAHVQHLGNTHPDHDRLTCRMDLGLIKVRSPYWGSWGQCFGWDPCSGLLHMLQRYLYSASRAFLPTARHRSPLGGRICARGRSPAQLSEPGRAHHRPHHQRLLQCLSFHRLHRERSLLWMCLNSLLMWSRSC